MASVYLSAGFCANLSWGSVFWSAMGYLGQSLPPNGWKEKRRDRQGDRGVKLQSIG
jgi:hypothetical protein